MAHHMPRIFADCPSWSYGVGAPAAATENCYCCCSCAGYRFKNGSGETIPAGAIIRSAGLVDDGGEKVIDAQKPNTYGAQYSHYVNALEDVASNATGRCFRLSDCLTALYDSADGTPAAGETWGPRSGTWKLKKNTGGFLIVGRVGLVTERL